MTQHDVEKLFQELSFIKDEHPDGPIPPDQTLQAYREGSLSEEETRRLEALLAENPAALERLAESGGITPPRPSPEIWKRVSSRIPRPARPLFRGHKWFVGAAALAAVLLLVVGFWFQSSPGLPQELTYEVKMQGYSPVRAQAATAGLTQAYAEDEVRIDAVPRDNAMAGLDFGLYRERDVMLERIATEDGLHLETNRGEARFTALAADLVGSEPGEYTLFMVIAHRGGLPGSRRLEPGQEPTAVLAAGPRKLVYSLPLKLLPNPDPQ